ncbi:MAG: OadG family protein [Spirochaetaceae bacterium]|jgi:oxaloacetate decarboxylase gamma subunit|nr:OadG family protein [Spirochaetaceae bacterium]
MTIAQMFNQSGVLALLGMSVVFGFLIILVVVISVAGRIIHALGLDKELSAAPAVNAVSGGAGGVDGAVVAAITAAVKAYRKE